MSKAEATRTSCKRSILRMAQTVNRFTNVTSLPELETHLDILEDYWVQFQEAQLTIESNTGPQSINLQVIEMVDTETLFVATKTKIKTFIKGYSDSANHQSGNQNEGTPAKVNHSHLPKLKVPSSTKNVPNQQESNKNNVLVTDSMSSFAGLKHVIRKQVLLSTALLKVRSSHSHLEICRAFFDNGFQSNATIDRCAKSLNLRQYTGLRLQRDLLQIILRFRCFKLMVSLSIDNMFRQISMNAKHRRYQKIWSKSSKDSILNTKIDHDGLLRVVRNFPIVKPYIAVCLTTKSIHLEVVSDQSSEKFTNALKRFVSRNGLSRKLVRYKGSNFVGAKGELDKLWNMLQDQVQCDIIKKRLANYGIDWHMHSPGASHLNGLFEDDVKLTKFYLRKDNYVRVAKMKMVFMFLTKKEAEKLKLLGFHVSSAKVKTNDSILERQNYRLCASD